MANSSKIEERSAYEVNKNIVRFLPKEGQMHGSAHTGPRYYIVKAPGNFTYPVHIGKKAGSNSV